jgi:hypothetical protein
VSLIEQVNRNGKVVKTFRLAVPLSCPIWSCGNAWCRRLARLGRWGAVSALLIV